MGLLKRTGLLLILAFFWTVAAAAAPSDTAVTAVSPQIIVFVSFSLPVQSLVAIVRDADRIQASVVVRGLADNNFKSTFTRSQDVISRAGRGGLSIDPLIFSQYGIFQVPTVLVRNASDTCFDSLSGDIPLVAALAHIRDHGECHFPLDPLITLLQHGDAHA